MKEPTVTTLASLNQSDTAAGLPLLRLLALTLSSFIATANETVPAGLLPQVADSFQVSEALAGQWVTLCALGSGLGAIPLTLATRNHGRRSLLLLSIALFFICNAVTALSSSYGLILLARFIVGLATGLAWSLMAGCARRMVGASLQGRALALAMLGIPLALSLGVPLSAWLAKLVEWRVIFGLLSTLSLLLMLWIRLSVPEAPAEQQVPRQSLRKVLTTPGVRPVLFVVWMWIMAHYTLYTYIAPFLESVSPGIALEQVLLVFGLSAMLGVWLVGLLVDRWLRALILLSLGTFALVALGLGLWGRSPIVLYIGVALWGLSFSGAPTLLQTALADAAGDGAEQAQSMLVTVFNLAYAGSGIVGAVTLETQGAAFLPWTLVAWLLAGLLVAWQARRHAFLPGRRTV
ncbi:MFS transporter [Pseudomonas gingeri]|uniref:MFS transporter n=1 Tax=Pseudomonas gingeri TaxID=117681 RepID=UPI0015A2D61A|nr:MFS transporter [Pseudomonas gingeri]NWE25900.1 MFS transporter [Pseudomonas gingeri]NWE96244.1 MFS transporter [Pseudomonas gingeri]